MFDKKHLLIFIWPSIATLLCIGWSIIFWYVFILLFSWELLHIPIGLAGGLYFVFFIKPVAISSALYQIMFYAYLRKKEVLLKRRFLLTLWIPFALISVFLIIYCPDCCGGELFRLHFLLFVAKLNERMQTTYETIKTIIKNEFQKS